MWENGQMLNIILNTFTKQAHINYSIYIICKVSIQTVSWENIVAGPVIEVLAKWLVLNVWNHPV